MSERQNIEVKDWSETADSSHKTPNAKTKKTHFSSNIVRLALILIILLAAIVLWLAIKSQNYSPVPKSIQKSVNFPIYYPDKDKLPPGYYLDTSSFTNNSSAVLYAIRYANGQKKVFVANQPKPAADIISNFESKTIPLHFTYKTPIGTATIGAIAPNSVVSLPTSSDVWLIITAPGDIKQNQLHQLLSSLKR